MKTKLLKKIRKQYDWYLNKDGFPVVIDHKNKSVFIIDLEYMCESHKYTLEDVEKKVSVSHQLWCFRELLYFLLKPYGWDIRRTWYKSVVSKPITKNKSSIEIKE